MEYLKFLFGCICICFFLHTKVEGQHTVKDVEKRFTSSPVVSSQGTYGGMDVKKSSGGISKSINIFQLKEGNISYNPSIEYFSTGVKVDEWGGRLGMTWNDNFTGIIQRTVKSIPDERASVRVDLPPGDLAELTSTNLDRIKKIALAPSIGQGYDAEYDVFSYNIFGESGSFIIKNNEGVLLNHEQGARIQILSINPYTFCLTKSNGFKYFFGADSKIEYTRLDMENPCDLGAPSLPEIATAWFLNRVESSFGDVITFEYEPVTSNYIYDYNESFTVKYRNDKGDDPVCNPYEHEQAVSTSCFRKKISETQVLTSVNGTAFTLDFTYTSRNDLVGEKILNQISLSDKASNLIGQANFFYDEILSDGPVNSLLSDFINGEVEDEIAVKSRYFLNRVVIGKEESLEKKIYSFSYNQPGGLPHRFSFRQDLHGYFNGQMNSSMIPKSKVIEYAKLYPKVLDFIPNFGNRDPYPVGQAGLLKTITYPTGGVDEILYEPNSYTVNEEHRDSTSINGYLVNNTGTAYTDESFRLDVPFSQIVDLYVSVDHINPVLPSDDEGEIYYMELQVWDTNAEREVKFKLEADDWEDEISILRLKLVENKRINIKLQPGVSYEFRFHIAGNGTSVFNDLKFYPSRIFVDVEKPFYGNRVKQIISNPKLSPSLVKTFNYKMFTKVGRNLLFSDTTSINMPYEISGYANSYFSQIENDCPKVPNVDNVTTPFNLRYHKFSSKSSYNTDMYQGIPYSYSCVTEFLDQGQSSFIASEFQVSSNEDGTVLIGDYSPFMPLSNRGWDNGIELKRYFGNLENKSYTLVKEQNWKYKEAPNVQVVDNYIVNKVYDPMYTYSIVEMNFLPYSVIYTPMYSRWHYLEEVKEVVYGTNKLDRDVIYSGTKFKYNPFSKLLQEEESANSKLEMTVKRYIRPHELVDANLDPSGTYQAMINQFHFDPIIEEIQFKNNTQINKVKKSYFSPFANLFVPFSVETQVGEFPSEIQLQYHSYDNKGNVLSLSEKGDLKSCYVWGYGGQYLIARIENSDYDTLVAILGADEIEDFRENPNPTDAEVNDFLAPLRFDVRLNNALITTYTYKPLVGMSSISDYNNKTIYYEYDNLNRLRLVRDDKGNIIKVYDYKYSKN